MKRSYTFFVLCLILLTACTSAPLEPTKVAGAVAEPPPKDAGGTLSSPVMDAQTNTPNPTGTLVPRATVVATATEAPTATIDVETKTNEEIIARVNQFLNSEGDYTDKNLDDVLLKMLNTRHELANNLGLARHGGSFPDVIIQNLLLGYKMDQNYAYLIMGNEDKKGERFVYIACTPLDALPAFEFNTTILNFAAFGPDTFKVYKTESEIKGFLDQKVGKGLTVDQFIGEFSGENLSNPYVQMRNEDIKFAVALTNRVQRPESNETSFVAGDGSVGDAGFFYKCNSITVDDLKNLTPNKNMIVVNAVYVRKETP
jgi:hypothetical protein